MSSPEELNDNVLRFHAALRGFRFVQGESCAEFRQGDRAAEYGLAALVVDGAAAAAASTGIMCPSEKYGNPNKALTKKAFFFEKKNQKTFAR